MKTLAKKILTALAIFPAVAFAYEMEGGVVLCLA